MNNNLDKNLDPKLEKFIGNVKAEFDNLTYKHRLNLSRELKKLSLSYINPKDKQGKSEDNSVSNADKLLDLQLKISEDLEKYKAFLKTESKAFLKSPMMKLYL